VPSGERLLLAIDTSTEIAGLSLYDGDLISEVNWNAGRSQTRTIVDQLRNLLAVNQCRLSGIGAIAVAIGPGSFNGLRVGLSLAKGLSYGLELPIFGVVTLDLVAYPHARSRTPIRAVVRAGRDRVVYADYQHRHGRWERSSEMLNRTLEELTMSLPNRVLVAGELDQRQVAALEQDARVVLPSPALRVRRPSYLAEIGFERWQAGEADALDRLEPIYIHGIPPSRARSEDASETVERSLQASR